MLAKYFVRDAGSFYREKTFVGTDEEYLAAKRMSATVFVSNIPEDVHEECVWELFMLCGPVRRVVMGINRNTLRFCGFCFVEFYSPDAAEDAVRYLKDFRLGLSPLNVDKDYGFMEGRQYGRGVFGGRVKVDKQYLERHRTKRRHDGPRDDRLRYFDDVDAKRRRM